MSVIKKFATTRTEHTTDISRHIRKYLDSKLFLFITSTLFNLNHNKLHKQKRSPYLSSQYFNAKPFKQIMKHKYNNPSNKILFFMRKSDKIICAYTVITTEFYQVVYF